MIGCPSGSILQTSFGGIDFSLCVFGESGATALCFFSLSGGLEASDQEIGISVSVEYLSSPIKSFSAPALSGKRTACPVLIAPTSVTPKTLALLTGGAIQPAAPRHLKAASSESKCACKYTPRPCVYFHGLGNPNEEAGLQDTPKLTKNKVGNIGEHPPCCITVKYAVLNTVDYGWTNDSLQQKFCDHSLPMSSTSDLNTRIIRDTIIIMHSMGGLTMAGALVNGRCRFSDSTAWVSMSAPMRGSMDADFSQDVCKSSFLSKIYRQSPASAARKSHSYQNELNIAYAAAQEAYRGNVTAAMCSTDYRGLFWGLDAASFGDSYRDRFYAPKLNHADTAFLTHDSFFRDLQKPFKWFECLL
ncbi:hypothetical protein PHYSODRAFT_338652 [Phytophthora sojae]|uniref:Uncharacterized protein n=1 Tax=Phytophthora sojae (strain P6497) TaxID=1094619 RepID=G5A2Q3_PHYSP|nr:hypothetical protein PHYSODRAFT_338652 [Phytophthora sojae]EGZ09943.1 hypothetical protein PHYSODRAFT_338652 [Phytophthora sojae]|eukprot:XP_009534804.1 hypothetical protein PHYSODRAFT_338652 [Phytophthora sojae]